MIHVRNLVLNAVEPTPVMVEVVKMMLRLSGERFHGNVSLQFSDGQVVLVRKEETFKPGHMSISE